MEKWKNIKGYEGFYQVSNLGRIKSLDHMRKAGKGEYMSKGKILKIQKCSNGYQFITLCKKGKKKQILIHRLVAKAFVEGYAAGLEVNHKNEDKTDNHVDNLEWMTHKENMNHGTCIKRRTENSNFKGANNPMYGRRGKLNSRSKPLQKLDENGNVLETFSAVADAGRKLGLNISRLASAARGYKPKAYGFYWKYKPIELINQ